MMCQIHSCHMKRHGHIYTRLDHAYRCILSLTIPFSVPHCLRTGGALVTGIWTSGGPRSPRTATRTCSPCYLGTHSTCPLATGSLPSVSPNPSPISLDMRLFFCVADAGTPADDAAGLRYADMHRCLRFLLMYGDRALAVGHDD